MTQFHIARGNSSSAVEHLQWKKKEISSDKDCGLLSEQTENHTHNYMCKCNRGKRNAKTIRLNHPRVLR